MSQNNRCRSCGSEIVWGVTAQGKPCPLDKDTMRSHYTTCQHPDRWSKSKEPQPELPGQQTLFPKEPA